LLRMEDTRAVASWLGAQELLQNSVLTPDEVVSALDAVEPSEIAKVASSYLNDEKMRLAVVGPRGGQKALTGMLSF
jgi:predicted Zn-dependent peptidase